MKRPKWMRTDLYVQFMSRWSPAGSAIRCVFDGCSNLATTVDHITPRVLGGSDELSNLQPMCSFHNSSKGARPDDYWSRTFYWDQPIDLGRLRIAQSDFVYNAIAGAEAAEFFSRPISQISGKLLSFIQIVGAGKTLGMFVAPFALNRVIRSKNPHAPRTDKMLIVTKGQALREQIAYELRTEPVNFGIVSEPPRVLEIKEGAQFCDKSIDYDIAVMCPNLLWPDVDVDGQIVTTIHRTSIIEGDVMRRHPVKFFDELHYAHKKIHQFVQHDLNSLVFGVTASPIEAKGGLLRDVVRMSCYGYDQAARNDGSMKLLNNRRADDITKDGCVNIITAEQQEINGDWIAVRDSSGNLLRDRVADGLATVKAVADGVVRALHTLDHFKGDRKISRHRHIYRKGEVYLADDDYVAHGLITVSDAKTAEDLAEYLNGVFSSNRDRFPRKGGWYAHAVHGAASDKSNQSLKTSHPFFGYKNKGKVDASCCRVMVVVDMAVEGMNNKYLNVLGIGQTVGSVKEIVQRIGRVLRSSHVTDEASNSIYVPSEVFDKCFLVTHEAFRSRDGSYREISSVETIDQAVDFIVNMERNTNNLENIVDYIQSDDVSNRVGNDADANLTRFEKFNIINDIANTRRQGRNPQATRLVKHYAGGGSKIKEGYVRAFVKSAMNGAEESYDRVVNNEPEATPVSAYEDFVNYVLRFEMPRAKDQVLDDEREYVRLPGIDELVEWIGTQPTLGTLLELKSLLSEEVWKGHAQEVYKSVKGSYSVITMAERMQSSLQEVDTIVTTISQGLGVTGKRLRVLREIVHEAVLHYLGSTGIKNIEQLGEGGTHNRPGITHVLRSRDFNEELRGYALAKLLQVEPDNPIFDLMPDLLRDFEFFQGKPESSELWEDLQGWDDVA